VGIHGERSGLWFEYWRIINDLRPRFAIMENVGMLVHRGLREVLGSLSEIGYNAEWQDIRASDVGAPHRRERIWIVAYPGGARSWSFTREIGADRGRRTRRDESTFRPAYGENGTDRIDAAGCVEEFPHPSLQLPHGSGEARGRRGEFADGGDVPDAATTGLERQEPARGGPREPGLSAECGWWTTEPAICGMVDGLPAELHGYEGRLAVKSYQRVNRLRGLGNAIVPQIAELLFRQIFAKTS